MREWSLEGEAGRRGEAFCYLFFILRWGNTGKFFISLREEASGKEEKEVKCGGGTGWKTD